MALQLGSELFTVAESARRQPVALIISGSLSREESLNDD
jgi:hypothetical protein